MVMHLPSVYRAIAVYSHSFRLCVHRTPSLGRTVRHADKSHQSCVLRDDSLLFVGAIVDS